MERKMFLYGRWFFNEPRGSTVVDFTQVKIYVDEGSLAEFFRGLPGEEEILKEVFRLFPMFDETDLDRKEISITTNDFSKYSARPLLNTDARKLGEKIRKILSRYSIKTELKVKPMVECRWLFNLEFQAWEFVWWNSENMKELTVHF